MGGGLYSLWPESACIPEEVPFATVCEYLAMLGPLCADYEPIGVPCYPHNGNHTLRFGFEYTPPNGCGNTVTQYLDQDIYVKNLVITSVTPEDHVTWDGTDVSSPITVTLDDNDLSGDPVDITLSIYSCASCASEACFPEYYWEMVRTMTLEQVTGNQHVFNWDGKDDQENDVPPGVYTYQVEITQHHEENPYNLPAHLREFADALNYDDCARFRSHFLHIERAADGQGNPIYDAIYYGYDDNGTPENPGDDNHLYLLRWYILRDSKDAHSGYIKMYESPSMAPVGQWNVASLKCVEHGMATDGLQASAGGQKHGLLVPVPVSSIECGCEYKLVLHMVDDHAYDYRNHQRRPALDLNSTIEPRRVDRIAVVSGGTAIADGPNTPEQTDVCAAVSPLVGDPGYVVLEAILDPPVGSEYGPWPVTWTGGEPEGTTELRRKVSKSAWTKETVTAKYLGGCEATMLVYVIGATCTDFSPANGTSGNVFSDNTSHSQFSTGGFGTGILGPDSDGGQYSVCEIQFTTYPEALYTDGVNGLFQTSQVAWDVKREIGCRRWNYDTWYGGWVCAIRGPLWTSDDATNGDEDLNPWDGDSPGHIYSHDNPGVDDAGGDVVTACVMKLVAKEWAEVKLGEQAQVRCSEDREWHAFRSISKNAQGQWQNDSSYDGNSIATGYDIWGVRAHVL